MRINSIKSYNTTPMHFQGKQKNNGARNLRNAAMLATALTASAPMYQSCEKLTQDIVHNHYLKLPTDTFLKEELKPVPVPPQIIFIETEKPGKTDTIVMPGDTIVTPPDTIYLPGDTIIKNDTIVTPGDTVYVPGDTIIKNDTIYMPNDTVVIPGDTVYLPGDTVIKNDTVYLPGDTVVTPGDTVYLPGDTVIKNDTVYLPGDTVTVRDTIRLPGDTVFIKDEWTSPVPPKQEEIYDEIGIKPNGNGKFFIYGSYYDEKNNELVQRKLHGQGSSRDGKILVYNVVKTKWDDAAEGVVLGKNESFEKHLVYLSEDGRDLGIKVMIPKVDIKVSNNDKKSNWQVFSKGTLSTPDAWKDGESFFMQNKGGVIDITNGFKLEKGLKEQSVTVTNPYSSKWELSDWNVVKGDPD